jgi:hypothetical protein
MSHDTTLDAMKALTSRIDGLIGGCRETGHPLDLNRLLEPEFMRAAAAVSTEKTLDAPIPKLCTLVVASPFDAAISRGVRQGPRTAAPTPPTGRICCPAISGPILAATFRGMRLDSARLETPVARVPVFHSLGALDPLVDTDVAKPIGEGLPETLAQWIPRDGVVRIKIKLSDSDLALEVDSLPA